MVIFVCCFSFLTKGKRFPSLRISSDEIKYVSNTHIYERIVVCLRFVTNAVSKRI